MAIVGINEHRMLRDIVSPLYCGQILEMGVPNVGNTYWMQKNETWTLWTYEFDPDHYYEETDKLIYELNPANKPSVVMAAFTTGDLLAALPSVLVTSTSPNDYEVSCDFLYGNHCAQHQRLPDALALLLMKLLQTDRYSVNYVTSKILNQ